MFHDESSLYTRIGSGRGLVNMYKRSQICQLTIVQNGTPGNLPEMSQGKVNSYPTYLIGSWWESGDTKVAMWNRLFFSPEWNNRSSLAVGRPWPGERCGFLGTRGVTIFAVAVSLAFQQFLGQSILSWDFGHCVSLYPWLLISKSLLIQTNARWVWKGS